MIDERQYEDWNGLSRTSVQWLQKQNEVIKMLKENPNEDLDLIGLSAMLTNMVYNLEADAKRCIRKFMSDMVALVITNDLHFTRYYQIDARDVMHVIYCTFKDEDREHLVKVVGKDLQNIYEHSIEDYRNNFFMDENVDMSKFDLLPKDCPWTLNDLLDKGVNDLVLKLTEAMEK